MKNGNLSSGLYYCTLCLAVSFPERRLSFEDLVREGKIHRDFLNSHLAIIAYQEAGGRVSVVQEFFQYSSPFHGREYFGTV